MYTSDVKLTKLPSSAFCSVPTLVMCWYFWFNWRHRSVLLWLYYYCLCIVQVFIRCVYFCFSSSL